MIGPFHIGAARELQARFTADELEAAYALPYPVALREARERRASALGAARLHESPESARETNVILSLHALFVSVEPETPIRAWNGCAP